MIIELNSLADFKHYFITVDGFTEDINIKKGITRMMENQFLLYIM